MAAADYRLLTEATGQRIAAALEALSGTGAAAAAARTNLDVYSKGETDTAIAQSTAITDYTDQISGVASKTEYINRSDASHVYTCGEICMALINFSVLANAGLAYRDKVLSGFPHPRNEIYLVERSGNTFRIDTSGNLITSNEINPSNNTSYVMNFAYPVAL